MCMYSVYLCLYAVHPGFSSQGRGSVVVVNSDILPTFGVIKDIVMDSFYSLWKFYTQYFFPHNHAHEVSMNTPPLYELVKSSDLYMTILF